MSVCLWGVDIDYKFDIQCVCVVQIVWGLVCYGPDLTKSHRIEGTLDKARTNFQFCVLKFSSFEFGI